MDGDAGAAWHMDHVVTSTETGLGNPRDRRRMYRVIHPHLPQTGADRTCCRDPRE
jgi:hypothetical protein